MIISEEIFNDVSDSNMAEKIILLKKARRKRELNNVTQGDVGTVMETSSAWVGRIENNQGNPSNKQIAKYLTVIEQLTN